jgi:hypothetical protein
MFEAASPMWMHLDVSDVCAASPCVPCTAASLGRLEGHDDTRGEARESACRSIDDAFIEWHHTAHGLWPNPKALFFHLDPVSWPSRKTHTRCGKLHTTRERSEDRVAGRSAAAGVVGAAPSPVRWRQGS